MGNLLIRDLPEEIHQALKRRAALNSRSLQTEVQRILSSAVNKDIAGSAPRLSLRLSNAELAWHGWPGGNIPSRWTLIRFLSTPMFLLRRPCRDAQIILRHCAHVKYSTASPRLEPGSAG